MSEAFIKLNRDSEEVYYLLEHHPNAFLLLTLISLRARRTCGSVNGLDIGEAYIGDFKKCGIETRQKYRTALEILIKRATIEKVETCRNRKKSTTGTTTEGTKVKLLSSKVWDVNLEQDNHRINHRTTTEQPPDNHEQECKEVKNDKNVRTTTTREEEKFVVVVQKKSMKTSTLIENKEGHMIESLESIFKYATLNQKDWTEHEINSAYEIMYAYKEKISNTFLLVEGIIQKNRQKQTKTKEKICKTKSKIQKKQKPKSVDASVISYLNGTSVPPLAKYALRNGLSLS